MACGGQMRDDGGELGGHLVHPQGEALHAFLDEHSTLAGGLHSGLDALQRRSVRAVEEALVCVGGGTGRLLHLRAEVCGVGAGPAGGALGVGGLLGCGGGGGLDGGKTRAQLIGLLFERGAVGGGGIESGEASREVAFERGEPAADQRLLLRGGGRDGGGKGASDVDSVDAGGGGSGGSGGLGTKADSIELGLSGGSVKFGGGNGLALEKGDLLLRLAAELLLMGAKKLLLVHEEALLRLLLV